MGHPINDSINVQAASAPLAERIQKCLQSKHTLDYILVTKLALDEGEPELARKLAQEGVEYFHSRALFDDDDPQGFRFITLYELVGEFNLAQKYCESYDQYEKGGDLALKLGQPDEARRWWARQIEFNELENPERHLIPGMYLGKNVLLAKKIGDESLAQKFYDQLVSYADTQNEAGDPPVAEVMGDSRHAVRWYRALDNLGNAARVAIQSDQNYRGIMEEIVEKFDHRGISLMIMMEAGSFYHPSLEQVEAQEDFWKELLATAIGHYRRKDCWDIAKRLQAGSEPFISPGKANVYLTLEKWLEEKSS